MKNLIAAIPFLLITLSACSDNVPKVDDPHNVVVNGRKMTQSIFLQTYCVGNSSNSTCDQVRNAMSKDASKGDVSRF